MKTKTFLQRIALSFFTILLLVVAVASASAQCPSPTVLNAAGECILTRETRLDKALILRSNTALNCHSHRIFPRREGLGNTRRSDPEVGIFLDGAQNVQIKNCFIDKFDFGIFAINSKHPVFSTPIQIAYNNIQSRFAGISLMFVDDAEVRHNQMRLTINGGRAIYVGRNSDRNRILDNEIGVVIPTLFNDTKVFRAPGPELPGNQAVPTPTPSPGPGGTLLARAAGSAVLITQTEGPEPSLLNVVIEGASAMDLCGATKCVVSQLEVKPVPEPNVEFSEDNVVEGNTIRFRRGTLPVDGIVLAIPQRTRVSKNVVIGGNQSIRVGIQTAPPTPPPGGARKQFSGTCSNSGRRCLGPADCSILDGEGPGNCPLPMQTTGLFWVSYDTIITDNSVFGPFAFGISTTGQGTVITGNRVLDSTVTRRNPRTGTGIFLVGPMTLNQASGSNRPTVVSRNIVHNMKFALSFVQTIPTQPPFSATSFGVMMGLNDFTSYDIAVKISNGIPPATDNTYSLFGDLSAMLEGSTVIRGNFWDLGPIPCPKNGFDLEKVRNSDGSPQSVNPQPHVIDSNPFSAPVALIRGIEPPLCQ
jgi:hypothetical protein